MQTEELHILFVDDDPDDLAFFKEALARLDLTYKLFTVDSCKGVFMHIAEKERFDLIFLDINMPEVDGKECLKALKANEDYRHVPVIIFTVSQSPDDINEVYESGAHYYMVKPYAHINFVAALKIVFSIDWKSIQPVPARKDFVINLSYN